MIARRIEGLEKDARRYEAAFTPHKDRAGEVIRNNGQVVCGPKGNGAHAVQESELPKLAAWYGRWLAHVTDRLMYERAALAAAGGIQAQLAEPGGEQVFEVGGAVKGAHWVTKGCWVEITKINPSSVEVYVPFEAGPHHDHGGCQQAAG